MTAEERRLEEARSRQAHWKRWGPYVSDRAWGTVREDYSAHGTAWEYLPHDHARSRAYRWNEDGLAGISDRHQELCLALALWNGRDPILKERLFGLTGNEGNHGEDVKEYYFHLDSTPTHSFMRMLYKYPQAAFPYGDLVEENRRRDRSAPDYELIDTGVFEQDRYFDVFVEYAKVDAEDVLMQVTVCNRGPEAAPLHVLPTVWFRNTWSWNGDARKGVLEARPSAGGCAVMQADTVRYGRRWVYFEGAPELLFTENETNTRRLFGFDSGTPYAKDGINDHVVQGQRGAVNPMRMGTKAAAHYVADIRAGGAITFRIRLSPHGPDSLDPVRSVRRDLRGAATGGRRLLRAGDSAVPVRRCPGGHASEPCRHAVVEAVLPLCRQGLGRRRPGAAGSTVRAPARAQSPVASSVQRRRHLDAGQVGVPLVCGVGPGVPLPAAGPRRLRLCEGAAAPDAPRVVHAPQRPVAGLRMGLRRRQPAGARVGGVARLQDREEAARRRRPRVPRARVPEAPAQLHLVGEPQGRRRQQRVRGRLSRPRQHRRLRPVGAAPDRRPHRTVRRHQLDGDVLAQPARHGDGARAREPGLRRRGQQVLGALPLHRPRDRSPGEGQEPRPLGRRGRLLLRHASPARWQPVPDEGAVDGRPHPALCRGNAGARSARASG